MVKENEKDVFVFVEDVVVSGGYMFVLVGDEIIVDLFFILGFIGVVVVGFGFIDLIKKIGVECRVYMVGEKKVMFDLF